jgi:hypothetical protein
MSERGAWTTPRDLSAHLARLWERGTLLAAQARGESPFPLRLALKAPDSAAITDRFDTVRRWAAELAQAPHLRIEWRSLRHRVHGAQRLPACAWVDTQADALALIGKRRDAERFEALLQATRDTVPALLPWLARRPLQALELSAQWPALLAVVAWVTQHPRPGVYLRQVDLPGVHTKFVETHRAVLAELLDLVLPPEAIRADCSGVTQFAARYGFLDKPLRIRLRVLDPGIALLPGGGCPDLTLDAQSFARLDEPAVQQVFITENETNFLAFPPCPRAIVLFGAGYGWEALAPARWLERCGLHYWGDIDTHGFAILDQLRARFPRARSFLMDRETLMAHREHWSEEPRQALRDLPRLSDAERALYDALRDNRIQPRLRLEQERVGFGWVEEGLGRLGSDGGAPSEGASRGI